MPIKTKSINLKQPTQELKKEILKTFLYFKKNEAEKPLFITGNEKLEILTLLQELKKEVNIELIQIKNLFNNHESEFALTLGLALDHIKGKQPVQFLEKYKIVTKKRLRKTKQKIKILYICALLFFAFQIPLSIFVIHKNRSYLTTQKNKLLKTLNLPINENISLNQIKEEIGKTSKAFNYFNKNISFSSLMQFLNTKDLKNIEIKYINYKLEKNLIKIRLQCIITNQNDLNNFKNLLLKLSAKDTKVNTDASNNDLYVFSFYLKEKNMQELINEKI